MTSYIKTFWQYCLPQHLISRLVGWLAYSTYPPVKRMLIQVFIKYFKIDVAEADPNDPEAYDNFNQFFTRKVLSRTITSEPNGIISPADGTISQFGIIQGNRLLQAKGHTFTAEQLLGEPNSPSTSFKDGHFITIYLAPRDYHRVHMPITGQLKRMTYIPGRLFSVNQLTTQTIKGLFARNERVVCYFETEIGLIALVLVGAMLVASIKTAWAGIIAPNRENFIKTWDYTLNSITYSKGQEIGQFCYGSTVIVLFPHNSITFQPSIQIHDAVKMGQIIGEIRT